MAFLKDVKKGIDVVFHPSEGTKSEMSIGRALAFYYSFSVIPFIAFTAFITIASLMGEQDTVPFYTALLFNPGYAPISLIIGSILLFWVLMPIGLFIYAAIYQVVGKYIFRVWKGDYSRTFTAVTFGTLPVVLLGWLCWPIPIPMLGTLALAVFAIWEIVALIIALSNTQKISRLSSIKVVVFVSAIIAVVVISIYAWVMIGFMSSLGGQIIPSNMTN